MNTELLPDPLNDNVYNPNKCTNVIISLLVSVCLLLVIGAGVITYAWNQTNENVEIMTDLISTIQTQTNDRYYKQEAINDFQVRDRRMLSFEVEQQYLRQQLQQLMEQEHQGGEGE